MKIDCLAEWLKDITLKADTPIAHCGIEEGIRFLLPPPNVPVPGTVFAGTLSEWKVLCRSHPLCHEGTYLICTDDGTAVSRPPADCSCNLFCLNASVKTVLHRLTSRLTNQCFPDSERNEIYLDFWQSVMDGTLERREQATAYFQLFPCRMHTHLACIVISPDFPLQDRMRIQEIQLALRDFFQETNLFYHADNGEWIILYSQKKDTSVELDISYDAFSRLLEEFRLNAGISYACRLPEQFRILYLTASASVAIGRELKLAPYIKRIYTYHQYNSYYIIHLCSQRFMDTAGTKNLVYLAHPDVVRLYYYDLENKNNLLDVLYAYLSNAQNLSLTSKALFMHRNTVLNKLNRITDFLGHKPFDERDHLLILLSCMILKYQCTQNEITDFFFNLPEEPSEAGRR